MKGFRTTGLMAFIWGIFSAGPTSGWCSQGLRGPLHGLLVVAPGITPPIGEGWAHLGLTEARRGIPVPVEVGSGAGGT